MQQCRALHPPTCSLLPLLLHSKDVHKVHVRSRPPQLQRIGKQGRESNASVCPPQHPQWMKTEPAVACSRSTHSTPCEICWLLGTAQRMSKTHEEKPGGQLCSVTSSQRLGCVMKGPWGALPCLLHGLRGG